MNLIIIIKLIKMKNLKFNKVRKYFLYTLLGLVVWIGINIFLGLSIAKGFGLGFSDFLYYVLMICSCYISYLVLDKVIK